MFRLINIIYHFNSFFLTFFTLQSPQKEKVKCVFFLILLSMINTCIHLKSSIHTAKYENYLNLQSNKLFLDFCYFYRHLHNSLAKRRRKISSLFIHFVLLVFFFFALRWNHKKSSSNKIITILSLNTCHINFVFKLFKDY